jgi:hypothetical protein
LIKSLGHKQLNEQYDIFNDTMEKWKFDKEQIDDILVMAVKL